MIFVLVPVSKLHDNYSVPVRTVINCQVATAATTNAAPGRPI